MEGWIAEALKQVPSLCVLALLTRWFLGHMKARDDQLLQHETARDKQLVETLRHLGHDCHEVQRDSIEVMNQVREELGRTREASQQLARILEDVRKGAA